MVISASSNTVILSRFGAFFLSQKTTQKQQRFIADFTGFYWEPSVEVGCGGIVGIGGILCIL